MSNSNLNYILSPPGWAAILPVMARSLAQSTRSSRTNRKHADRGTREQLLEIAGQVFAEKGFDRATSREICKRAAANVAAVNYHFGGIEALYIDVVRKANNRLVSVEAIATAVAGESDARSKLQAIIGLFIGALTGPASESWVIRVMGREIVSPSPLLHALREKEILPKARILPRSSPSSWNSTPTTRLCREAASACWPRASCCWSPTAGC